jgi:hypothetical protein
VTIDPWTLVNPNPPEDPGDPHNTPGITQQPARIPMIRPGQGGLVIGEPEADRAAPSPSRVPEAKAVLTGVTAARIDAIVYASNLPVGAYLAVEFEHIDAPGDLATAGGRDRRRHAGRPPAPARPREPGVARPAAAADGPWNVSGAFVAVVDDAPRTTCGSGSDRRRRRLGPGDPG